MRFDIGDDENYENIFNMEETPIWFEMVSLTTIAKIGQKSISIKTFGSERSRITDFYKYFNKRL